MLFQKRNPSQAGLEYLLLIGGSLIVAVIVATLLPGITESGKNQVQSAADSIELKKLQALTGVNLEATTAWYSFENGVRDGSGRGNHGKVNGNMALAPGKNGSGIYFPGTTGDNVILDSGAVNGLTNFTFMAWINTTDRYYKQALFSGYQGGNAEDTLLINYSATEGTPGGYYQGSLYLNNDLQTYRIHDPSSICSANSCNPETSVEVGDGQWHHFAWVRSESYESFYVDCRYSDMRTSKQQVSLSASPAHLAPLSVPNNGLVLGHRYNSVNGTLNGGFTFNGTMDDVFIIGRGLSANEIRKVAGC